MTISLRLICSCRALESVFCYQKIYQTFKKLYDSTKEEKTTGSEQVIQFITLVPKASK